MSALTVCSERSAVVPKSSKNTYYAIEFAITSGFLRLIRPLPMAWRSKLGGSVLGFLISNMRAPKARIDINLRNIFPNMSGSERRKITKTVGQTVGRTLIEILNNDTYSQQKQLFHASGPGLQTVLDAHANNKGVILVSSHFGQWDAPRHFLKQHNIEVAAVYRPSNNPHFDKLFLHQLEQGGKPIFPKGRRGTMAMVRHLRSDGSVIILVDQKYNRGEFLDFLGHKTLTSLAAAELSLRYNIPMIPVYGIRREGSLDIDIEFEAPIPLTDAVTMTQAANDSLAARVLENPGQWYWLHQRWNFKD